MPRHKVVYDPKLKETPEWKSLYERFRKIKDDATFNDFLEFYNWSMANGFEMGVKLIREDISKPFSPENCRWSAPAERKPDLHGAERETAIKKWNEAVNRIRVHFGLKPF